MVIQRFRMALADAIAGRGVRQVVQVDAGAGLTSLERGRYLMQSRDIRGGDRAGLLDEDLA
jgi:hypothetical protein